MKLQELIGHIKIEDANRNKDKDKVVTPTPSVKANVAEYKNAGGFSKIMLVITSPSITNMVPEATNANALQVIVGGVTSLVIQLPYVKLGSTMKRSLKANKMTRATKTTREVTSEVTREATIKEITKARLKLM